MTSVIIVAEGVSFFCFLRLKQNLGGSFMLTSLALIFLSGLFLGEICKQLKLPKLIGLLASGIILGPYTLNLLDQSILDISIDLRQIALIIILLRAGLSLDLSELKKVGRPAILMCFVPACFEIIGTVIFAPILLDISYLEAAIMGAVIAAVSPAVVVPSMLNIMNEGYGTKEGIPQLIMAGASVDDVFVIVLFSSFTALAQDGKFSFISLTRIPLSIISGILLGFLAGYILTIFFRRIRIRNSIKIIILLSVAFLLISLETYLKNILPLSGLLAVMAAGSVVQRKESKTAAHLSETLEKLWIPAEIFLFTLVGATIDLRYAVSAGFSALILIFAAMLFRMLGVFVSLIKTNLSINERLFCMIAYMPKATVQAAIGGIPLAMGLPCGKIVLTVAVLSIIITAPLGAFGINKSYRKLLKKS